MANPDLHELAEKYSVDKLYYHSYIPKYERLFKGRTVRRLLEIGIGYEELMKSLVPRYVHGASLKMWRDYFPEAQIFGCDIREDTLFQDERITTVRCDQSKPLELLGMLGTIGGDFDIIIDDGSHQLAHQTITAVTLLPYLAVGGIYIIEDVKTRYAPMLSQALGGWIIEGSKPWKDNLVVIYWGYKNAEDNLVVVDRKKAVNEHVK